VLFSHQCENLKVSITPYSTIWKGVDNPKHLPAKLHTLTNLRVLASSSLPLADHLILTQICNHSIRATQEIYLSLWFLCR
jgi:hypothetical protein